MHLRILKKICIEDSDNKNKDCKERTEIENNNEVDK